MKENIVLSTVLRFSHRRTTLLFGIILLVCVGLACSNPSPEGNPPGDASPEQSSTPPDSTSPESTPLETPLPEEHKANEPTPEINAPTEPLPEPLPEKNTFPPLRDGMKVKVRSVVDGDTVYVYTGTNKYPYYRIRMWGYNAPECHKGSIPVYGYGCKSDDEFYGLESFKYIAKMLYVRDLVLTVHCPDKGKKGEICKLDPYKRYLAYLLLPGGENVAVKMVKAGAGLVYTVYYPPLLKELCRAEAEAIRNKAGMWKEGRTKAMQGMSASTRNWYYNVGRPLSSHDAICTQALGESFEKLAGE